MDKTDSDYFPPVRPTGFASEEAEEVTPPGADFTLRQFTLACEDGDEVRAMVLISRGAEHQARTSPELCHSQVARAVNTDGRSVLESYVLNQDDPHLDWRVDMDGFRSIDAAGWELLGGRPGSGP